MISVIYGCTDEGIVIRVSLVIEDIISPDSCANSSRDVSPVSNSSVIEMFDVFIV